MLCQVHLECDRSFPKVFLLLFVCAATVTAACSSSEAGSSVVGSAGTQPAASEAPPTAVPVIAVGSIQWEACPGETPSNIACGRVGVPLRYDEPDGETTSAAFAIADATGDQIVGYLFVNPGGPGVSGREMVFNAAIHLGDDLLERFDVVGVDPRGTGGSPPRFACGDRADLMAVFAAASREGDTEAGERAVRMCLDETGQAAAYMHTEYAARDIEVVRSALGAAQISYYGASYGATLGLWYATLFDQRVRAMVLDGAANPNYDRSTRGARVAHGLGRWEPIEYRLRSALRSCSDSSCPSGSESQEDPVEWWLRNAERLELVADHFDGFGPAPLLATVTPLYAEMVWPSWHEALRRLVEEGDASVLAKFAALQLEGVPAAGEWSPWTTTAHINCLDDWALSPSLDAGDRIKDADALEAIADVRFPLLAAVPDLGWRYDLCPFYGGLMEPPATDVESLNAGLAPVLVIGNTYDPITPITHTEPLAAGLLNAVLLMTEHPQHVAYPGNACVAERVHAFLVDNVLMAGDCRS